MEKMRKKKGDTGRAILFLAPALLLICCFTVIPIFEAVYTSFHKTQYAMVGEFVGLKNYISVMVESDGWKNIVNSIVYVVLSLLLAMPIGVGIGTLLNQRNDNFPYDDYHSVDVVTDSYGTFMEMASQWKLWSDHFLGISTDWKKDGSFQYCDHCENSGSSCECMEYGSGRNHSDNSSIADYLT